MIAPLAAAALVALILLQPTPPPTSPGVSDPPETKPGEQPPKPPATIVPPHPVITEVLYTVPSGDSGDANGDGKRSATGDEFVELINPHDKPVDLRGYTIVDRSLGKPGSLKFVFPACRLMPGEAVVVFNGFESTWTGPVGDSTSAPKAPHQKFGGAWVFTMKNDSGRNGFSNSGDAVCLISPEGEMIQIVKWGKFDGKLPVARIVDEAPMTNRGSVQRESVTGKFVAHEAVDGGAGGGGGGAGGGGGGDGKGSEGSVRYSPGRFGKGGQTAKPEKRDEPEKKKPEKKKPG